MIFWKGIADGLDPNPGLEGDRYSAAWTPHVDNDPQQVAYDCEADEVLFGGAAGGGKSDLLIGLAVTKHQKSMIYRRQYTDVWDLGDRLDEVIPSARTNKSAPPRWTMQGGRFVELGGMRHDDSWKKYKGKGRDLIGFDELTEFTRNQYRMAIIWNRSIDPNQRCQVVATTNPPTEEEQRWVIEEWAPWLDPESEDPAEPGELRWYVYDQDDRLMWVDGPEPYEFDDGDVKRPKSRTFIRSMHTDNPFLSDEYDRTLDALPWSLRQAYKFGDFTVGFEEDPWRVIPISWVRLAQQRWRDLHFDPNFEPGVPMTVLGVDPSRGGSNETVLAPRYGDYIGPLVAFPGHKMVDGPAVATAVAAEIGGDEPTVVVDIIGVGASPVDALRANGFDVVGFVGSGKSRATDKSGKLKFKNARAEAYWTLREMLDPESDYEIALPDDPQLRGDLCAPRYDVTVSGIKIEAKDSIKERLGRSPDRGDAVVYAFADSTRFRRMTGKGFTANL